MPTSESGTATLGMTVADKIPQKQEDDHHHQTDGEHQLELHVVDRRANGLRAVGEDLNFDRGRQRRLQLRQKLLDAVGHADDVCCRAGAEC